MAHAQTYTALRAGRIGALLLAILLGGVRAISELNITVPSDYPIAGKDDYVCVVVELPQEPHKLVGVTPLADQSIVHHILLYGCTQPFSSPERGKAVAWNCMHHDVCAGGGEIIYGWGRNAPELHLPQGVGFSVGGGTNMAYIVAQVHFKGSRPPQDASGVMLRLHTEPTPLAAGVMTFASLFEVPADTASTKIPIPCCYQGHQPLTTVAFRVHAHSLGRSVTMTRQQPDAMSTEVVAANDPQLPQAFYPVKTQKVIWPGDRLTVTCDFDSRGRHRVTYAGATADDEMCNMYMMVYAPHPFIASCDGYSSVMGTTVGMPGTMRTDSCWVVDPSLFWKPPALPGSAAGDSGRTSSAQRRAAAGVKAPGDLTGVAVGGDGTLWALYRGNHPWTGETFDYNERMRDMSLIPDPVLLQLDPDTGKVLRRMGAGLFSLPHMITLDKEGHIWVVDVGMHVVFKLDQEGNVRLSVGTKFMPGDDKIHFCKPTHVAVARDGSFYVADGYCNSRVVKFSPTGQYQGELRIPAEEAPAGSPHVIHSVILDECTNQLYVAARESSKVYVGSTERWDILQTVNMAAHGKVWSLVMGPYGTPLAMAWDEGKDAVLAEVSGGMGGEPRSWVLPGVKTTSVHQAALGAAPPQLGGAADRLFALYVASTCCKPLLRFVMVPHGLKLPAPSQLQEPLLFPGAGQVEAIAPQLPEPPSTPAPTGATGVAEAEAGTEAGAAAADSQLQPKSQPDAGQGSSHSEGTAGAGGQDTHVGERHGETEPLPEQQLEPGTASGTQQPEPGTATVAAPAPQPAGSGSTTVPATVAGTPVGGQADQIAVQGGMEGVDEPVPGRLHVVGGLGIVEDGWRGSWGMRILAFLVFAVLGAVVGYFASTKLLVLRRAGDSLQITSPTAGQYTRGLLNSTRYHKADIDELLARSAQLEGLEEGHSHAATSTHASANGSHTGAYARHHELPASPFATATGSATAAVSHGFSSHAR